LRPVNLKRIGSALLSKSKDQFMTSQRGARIMGFLGGFAAGLANASFYLARSMDNTPVWDWILRGGIQYTLFTFQSVRRGPDFSAHGAPCAGAACPSPFWLSW
jgi:hypothetical protein